MNDNPNDNRNLNTSDVNVPGMLDEFNEEAARHNAMAESARAAGVTVKVGKDEPVELEIDGSLKAK